MIWRPSLRIGVFPLSCKSAFWCRCLSITERCSSDRKTERDTQFKTPLTPVLKHIKMDFSLTNSRLTPAFLLAVMTFEILNKNVLLSHHHIREATDIKGSWLKNNQDNNNHISRLTLGYIMHNTRDNTNNTRNRKKWMISFIGYK